MNQPSMTSADYLQSDEGKAFARKFLADLLLQPEAPPRDERGPNEEFEMLLHEYIEHLAQDMREYRDLTEVEENEMKSALTDLYKERFKGFYPSKGSDVYLMTLTRLARWLASFTCEAWLMATGHRQSPFTPQEPGEAMRAMHLHWAREAFGWWLSALSKLPYNIKIQRLQKRGVSGQLAAIVAEDPQLSAAVARLARGGIEVEDGCPLC